MVPGDHGDPELRVGEGDRGEVVGGGGEEGERGGGEEVGRSESGEGAEGLQKKVF